MSNKRRRTSSFVQLALAAVVLGLGYSHQLARAAEGDDGRDRVVPLKRAHSHNDYEHDRPLFDALDHGFCSVEADVFLVEAQLLVAHSILEVRKGRTLTKLYLEPLAERVKAGGGRVYRDGPEFTLMIDLKSDAAPTYRALAKELQPYADMLTAVRDGNIERRAVTIVLSGNRPRDLAAAEKHRLVGIDGRMGDLDSDAAPHLVPWISDNWTNHFKWNGRGEMPDEERNKLAAIVERAHRGGRKLRFWAAPDRREAWQALADAGVDLINTDDLAGLANFLREHKTSRKPMRNNSE